MINADSAKKKRWLIIPIETKSRELAAKTLMACFAAERGYRVILGESHAVRDGLFNLPAGIFLDKSLAPSRAGLFPWYKKIGNEVAAWSEEGLVFFDDDDYLKRKISRDALRLVACFFAWGAYEENLIVSRFPEARGRISIAGNPRVDLLRREYRDIYRRDADRLRRRFGAFVLINTNFHHCNHKRGDGAYVAMLKDAGKIVNSAQEEHMQGWVVHKKRLFEAFVAMVRRVCAEFPRRRVVLRPHPSENHDTWRRRLAGLSNLAIEHEGGVVPWIMASAVLVHNGCTTGIEAALLDHPAIAYRPVTSDVYDQRLPNAVSHQVGDEERLLGDLRRILVGHETDALVDASRTHAILRGHIGCLEGRPACEIILDRLDSIGRNIRPKNRRFWFCLHRLGLRPYLAAYNRLNALIVGKNARTDYAKQKFPGLDPSELADLIESLRVVSGRFSAVRAYALMDNVYAIRRDGARIGACRKGCDDRMPV